MELQESIYQRLWGSKSVKCLLGRHEEQIQICVYYRPERGKGWQPRSTLGSWPPMSSQSVRPRPVRPWFNNSSNKRWAVQEGQHSELSSDLHLEEHVKTDKHSHANTHMHIHTHRGVGEVKNYQTKYLLSSDEKNPSLKCMALPGLFPPANFQT